MIDAGAVVCVGFAREAETPTLYKGEVLESDDSTVIVRFVNVINNQGSMTGKSAEIHCRHNGRFMKVNAMVQMLMETTPSPVFRFLIEGGAEFANAEHRDSVRMCAAAVDLHAELGSEKECLVADISSGGLAVVACTPRKVGDVVRVTLIDGLEEYTGTVDIRSVRQRDDGAFRYGLQPTANANTLQRGLHKIAQIVQREQLRRMRCRA